jgi:hypothetical protein
MTTTGELSLWLALLTAVWSTLLLLAAAALARDDLHLTGARGLQATTALVAAATGLLTAALYRGDFALRYVAAVTGANLPAPFRLTALWAGPTGMQLVGALFLAAFSSIALWRARRTDTAVNAWAAAALGALITIILARVAVGANPFAPSIGSLVDGRGLPPDLQNGAAALYRPLLLAGDAAAAVAIALGATSGTVRSWTLASWMALTAAAGVKGWWAYASVATRSLDAAEAFAIVAWFGLSALLIAWTLRERVTNDRATDIRVRIGAVTMAAAVALVVAAMVGHARRAQYEVTIGDGESWPAKDPWGRHWTFTSQGASRIERANHFAVAVAFIPARDGVRRPYVAGEIREYVDADGADTFAPWTKPGIARGALEDVQIVLRGAGDGTAQVRISFEPLMSLAWIGAALFLAGGAATFWPRVRSTGGASMAERGSADAAELAISRWRERLVVCPQCGPRPEADATFCSNCGQPIARG